MATTYHLVPAPRWGGTDPTEPYAPPSLEVEGFIHCTDGDEAIVATANRFYAADPRPFLVLTVELDRLDAPWRYDDPARVFPHVYGPIARDAIVDVRPIRRATDGRFLAIEA
jgi:uncharacterized protein (DUF952 family)